MKHLTGNDLADLAALDARGADLGIYDAREFDYNVDALIGAGLAEVTAEGGIRLTSAGRCAARTGTLPEDCAVTLAFDGGDDFFDDGDGDFDDDFEPESHYDEAYQADRAADRYADAYYNA